MPPRRLAAGRRGQSAAGVSREGLHVGDTCQSESRNGHVWSHKSSQVMSMYAAMRRRERATRRGATNKIPYIQCRRHVQLSALGPAARAVDSFGHLHARPEESVRGRRVVQQARHVA